MSTSRAINVKTGDNQSRKLKNSRFYVLKKMS